MPAMTLGLAEVEERLRRVRRRLNTFTLLHAAFLNLGTILLGVALLIVFGFRAGLSFRGLEHPCIRHHGVRGLLVPCMAALVGRCSGGARG